MARRSKVVFCLLLAFLYVVVNICPLRAEALPDVMSGSTTLADNIMTYYALSGSAVANTDWINTLYNSYGSSFGTIEDLANQGYLVLNDAGYWEPVQELTQMIEQAPAYSSLGLNEIFNVSAEEAVAGGGFAAASGGSILAGSLGGVASTGVVPVLGGVTVAYWGGIALGTIIAHKLGLYGKPITNGNSITFADFNNTVLPAGQSCANQYVDYGYGSISKNAFYCKTGDYKWLVLGRLDYSGYKTFTFICFDSSHSNNNFQYYSYNLLNSTESSARNGTFSNGVYVMNVSTSVNDGRPYAFSPIKYFNSYDGYSNFVNGLKNGSVSFPKIYSPDMIGENGNLDGSYDHNDNKYTVPDMKPQIDPGTQAGKPLTLDDWLAFANAVQNNNNNVNPVPDDNKGLFQDILDLIKTVNPTPTPDPNPDPDPWSPPVVTPVPDPSYPDPVPDQQITENPQESENPQQTEDPIDTGKPWILPDLRNKFPFCIPWDIAKVFSKLKVNVRQAPHISWRFNPPNTPIDYTFNLDLEDFEEVATLLRSLELLGFIVGLAFATRYLIGAN